MSRQESPWLQPGEYVKTKEIQQAEDEGLSTMPKPIIDPTAQLTFSDYYSLRATDAEIADYFGYKLNKVRLSLPCSKKNAVGVMADEVERQIQRVLPFVNLDTEAARREILIAPLMYQLINLVEPQLIIEYPLYVSAQLKGTVDYYLKGQSSQILVVEAKQADTDRGFKQLIAELVAFQIREERLLPIYGAVTTGQTWHFGRLNPESLTVERDINFYTEPQGIEELLSVLVGILGGATD